MRCGGQFGWHQKGSNRRLRVRILCKRQYRKVMCCNLDFKEDYLTEG